MTNSSINLSKHCDPLTIDCLTDLSYEAKKLNIDFFVVGALVRILIIEKYHKLPIGVATLDLDIGITVTGWEHYKKLKDSLILIRSFTPDEKTYHRLWYNNKYPVDIIPFGAVETSEGLIRWPPDSSIEMNVAGFHDALHDAILVHLSEGLDVRFVSLPGMAVLKIIAWHDRHNEFPTKDAADIATLLNYYLDAGNDKRMFDEHSDLMEIENFEFELSGARMLGRDMAKIMSPQTKEMVLDILTLHTDPDKNDSLINAIIIYLPNKNYERGLKLLQNLKTGILDN